MIHGWPNLGKQQQLFLAQSSGTITVTGTVGHCHWHIKYRADAQCLEAGQVLPRWITATLVIDGRRMVFLVVACSAWALRTACTDPAGEVAWL